MTTLVIGDVVRFKVAWSPEFTVIGFRDDFDSYSGVDTEGSKLVIVVWMDMDNNMKEAILPRKALKKKDGNTNRYIDLE